MLKEEVIDYYHAWHLLYICTVFCLFLVSLTDFVPSWFGYVSLGVACVDIGWHALQKLRQKKIGTELFLVIATLISLIGHQERAMTIVLLIMLFAEYVEELIYERTKREIKSLISIIPRNVTIKNGEHECIIPIEEVRIGMLIIVKTGGRIPVDGIICEGVAEINESSLTGESVAKEKTVSEKVFAGTFIDAGSLTIKAEKIGVDTFFGKITTLVQQAEEKKAKISILSDKIAFYFVPSLLCFIAFIWFLTRDLNLVITLLVFGSPLELTLITPLTIFSAVIAAFRNGVLIKGGLVLERFSRVDTIFFDKTGTLTMGEPHVVKVQLLDPYFTEKDIIKIAAIAAKRSGHITSKALLNKAQEEGISVPDPEKYISVAGHGIEITYHDKQWFLGNRHFVEAPEHGNIAIPCLQVCGEDEFCSSLYLGCSGRLHARIFIADEVRDEAKQTIAELKKSINTIILLSGDKQTVASRIATMLGMSEAYGDVFPDQKFMMIEKLQNDGHIVAMVGDGINDAPALKRADVGIAMGAMGMEPAIEAADMILTTNDLSKINFAHQLSKQTFKIIKQNLVIGFAAFHLMGMILTFLGFLNPIRATLFHTFSDILILINAARLIRFSIK